MTLLFCHLLERLHCDTSSSNYLHQHPPLHVKAQIQCFVKVFPAVQQSSMFYVLNEDKLNVFHGILHQRPLSNVFDRVTTSHRQLQVASTQGHFDGKHVIFTSNCQNLGLHLKNIPSERPPTVWENISFAYFSFSLVCRLMQETNRQKRKENDDSF